MLLSYYWCHLSSPIIPSLWWDWQSLSLHSLELSCSMAAAALSCKAHLRVTRRIWRHRLCSHMLPDCCEFELEKWDSVPSATHRRNTHCYRVVQPTRPTGVEEHWGRGESNRGTTTLLDRLHHAIMWSPWVDGTRPEMTCELLDSLFQPQCSKWQGVLSFYSWFRCSSVVVGSDWKSDSECERITEDRSRDQWWPNWCRVASNSLAHARGPYHELVTLQLHSRPLS